LVSTGIRRLFWRREKRSASSFDATKPETKLRSTKNASSWRRSDESEIVELIRAEGGGGEEEDEEVAGKRMRWRG